jgi:hypothetical protein
MSQRTLVAVILVVLVILAVVWINRKGSSGHISVVVDHGQQDQSAPQPQLP